MKSGGVQMLSFVALPGGALVYIVSDPSVSVGAVERGTEPTERLLNTFMSRDVSRR